MGSTSPIPGYAIETLQWEVEIAPGWTEVLNGTVQEVYSQILQIEPNFKLASTPRTHPAERESKIERRAINCGTWPLANKGRIQEGISYLNGLVGSPTNGPGPGACGRVSCSYNAAIWWCNDVSSLPLCCTSVSNIMVLSSIVRANQSLVPGRIREA